MAIIQTSNHISLILSWFVFAAVLVYGVKKINIYRARRRFAAENGCEPLYNHALVKDPFLGLDELARILRNAKNRGALEYTKSNFAKYGSTHGKKVLGKRLVFTVEPENVKTVLSLNFKDYSFGQRTKSFAPLLGHGIFNSDGELWAHSRAMIRPNFTREQVADITLFERLVQDFLVLIPKDGAAVDLQDLFFRFTMDSATEFLFGRSVHTLRQIDTADDSLDGQFAEAFSTALTGCTNRIRLGFLRVFYRDPKSDAANKICHAYADQFVDEAVQYRDDLEKNGVKGEDDRYVFLRELAKATRDKKRLRDELLNVMLAGRDTTASLLSNLFFFLARRPDIWAKLRREVEETLHGALPTYEQLRNMKYLKYCLNESLRLHPVVPSNSRLAINDTILPLGGGRDGKSPLLITKGTIIIWQPYTMHRRKEYFGADADEFKPERWEHLRPGWEYLPFNGGPRICLGQQYALTEAGYVLTRMVQNFKAVEPRDERTEWEEGLTLTLCTHAGVPVSLTPA